MILSFDILTSCVTFSSGKLVNEANQKKIKHFSKEHSDKSKKKKKEIKTAPLHNKKMTETIKWLIT